MPETTGLKTAAGPLRSPGTLGVFVIDAPQVVRAGIALLVSSQPGMEVLLQSSDAESAVESIRRRRRNAGVVALVGLSLAGDHDSFWLIRAIREQSPSTPILATGTNPDDLVISRALFMGADGFVDKDSEPDEFIDAVGRTAAGETVLAGVPDTSFGRIADELARQPGLDSILTERELEVLTVASEGLTARQIGSRLGVRERTVTTHLSRIYRKLGAPSRAGAISAALRSGLVVAAPRAS